MVNQGRLVLGMLMSIVIIDTVRIAGRVFGKRMLVNTASITMETTLESSICLTVGGGICGQD
jgi:hypothetical protein